MTVIKRVSPTGSIIAIGALICVFLTVQFFPTAEIYDSLIYNQSNKAQVINSELDLQLSSSVLSNGQADPDAKLTGSSTEEKILNFLRINMGLSDYGAFAIMGNWSRESGLDPHSVEGCYKDNHTSCKQLDAKLQSGAMSKEDWMNYQDLYPNSENQYGYGLAQWTYPGRQENLWEFAKERGTYVGDLETQLLFFAKEWQGYDKDGSITEKLKKASSTDDMYTLVALFEKTYEGSADKDMTERNKQTEIIYNKFKNSVRPSANSSTNSTPKNTNNADWQKWILNNYNSFIGKPYVYGGDNMETGIDCSHFVYRLLQASGCTSYNTYLSSGQVPDAGYKVVSLNEAQVGDVVHWSGHLALYLGTVNGKDHQVIDAKIEGIPSEVEDIESAHEGTATIYRHY